MLKNLQDTITLALPKGRILDELDVILKKINLLPEGAFYDKEARQLKFLTNHANISIIRVRSFDVATFVAFGAADIGVVGNDVLQEFDYADLYAPLDLKIGHCRLSVAEPVGLDNRESLKTQSHVRVATKYPNLSKKYFAARGIQAECIKLNGAMELAPVMGLSKHIVDLVSTGKTLRENGLNEVETILEVSSRLIVNKLASKTKADTVTAIISDFERAVNG